MYFNLRHIITGTGTARSSRPYAASFHALVCTSGAVFILVIAALTLCNAWISQIVNTLSAAHSIVLYLGQLSLLEISNARTRAACMIFLSYSVISYCLFELAHIYLAGITGLMATNILWIYVIYNIYILVYSVHFILRAP
jgi:hypothetical protein